ncbi:MAG: tripartite tricarboxylate transporter substrate binding protein [Burkholderiales bacterium]|nr:tripartite tricarboxylate transporter substrate binding protein [Burkholderiales bacterium]
MDIGRRRGRGGSGGGRDGRLASLTENRGSTVRRIAAVIVAVLACASTAAAHAQAWPSRQVRLIVPFPPGGAVDAFARIVQPRLAEQLGQSVVIENRGGAGGMIGAEAVAKSPPDGHTLLVGNVAALAMNVGVYASMPYDPVRDFTPIMHTVDVNYVLAIHPAVPAQNLRELVAHAKAHPGRLTYGSAGAGSAPHLATELLKQRAGIFVVHIPYRGGGPMVADLLGGQIQMAIGDQANLMPQVRAGKLRAIGVGSARRSPVYPDLPTIAEQGYPGFEAGAWQGLAGPAGLAAPIVARMNDTLARVMALPDVRERLVGAGLDPVASSPEAFARHIRAEIAKWSKVAKDVGARAD